MPTMPINLWSRGMDLTFRGMDLTFRMTELVVGRLLAARSASVPQGAPPSRPSFPYVLSSARQGF